jgi:hypothetical protein
MDHRFNFMNKLNILRNRLNKKKNQVVEATRRREKRIFLGVKQITRFNNLVNKLKKKSVEQIIYFHNRVNNLKTT